ncbi:MAG TPA: PaaI family thioesterase [Allosphingosinicella sp.]|nr:PaaI family thioesterase [Allosphingosinicella sp.]
MKHGVATREQIAGLSGLEVLQRMMTGDLPAAPIAEPLGFRLAEVERGRAVFEGTPGPHLLNPLGSVHGGYALTLIDSACGCAVHSELDAGIGYTTVETKVNFTRAIDPDGGPVRCEGRVLSRGRTIATADAFLRDESGRLLAHGTSTLIILQPRG